MTHDALVSDRSWPRVLIIQHVLAGLVPTLQYTVHCTRFPALPHITPGRGHSLRRCSTHSHNQSPVQLSTPWAEHSAPSPLLTASLILVTSASHRDIIHQSNSEQELLRLKVGGAFILVYNDLKNRRTYVEIYFCLYRTRSAVQFKTNFIAALSSSM